MSYAFEWMPDVAVVWTVLLLLSVPEFAVIAVLVLALAALVAVVALAAAALASPYLLARSVRRRAAQRRRRWSRAPSGIRSRSVAGSPTGLGRAHVVAFAHDKPNEAGAILEDTTRDAA
jgi:hypothetical protein